MLWKYAFYAVLGFLSGGIMFSYLLPLWMRKVDTIACSADHNPGTANAFKYGGLWVGALCLLCDLGKGFIPVWFARQKLDMQNWWFAAVLIAPVLGHALAPFFRHGGKAIATAFGVLLALLPFSWAVVLLAAVYIFLAAVVRVRPNEKCSVITFSLFGVICMLTGVFYTGKIAVSLGCLGISAVAVWRNRPVQPVSQADEPQPKQV